MFVHAFWLPLLLKMAVTAAFVIIATKTAERAGALIAALIVTLPIAAGPAYIFLSLEHDADFIARSALTSFAVNTATYTFAVTYVLLAQKRSLFISLGGAFVAWAVTALIVHAIPWTLWRAILFNVAVFAACYWIANRHRFARMPLARARWYDVPLRAAMVSMLVATVVALSNTLGPVVTGILAVFPIVFFSMMLILQPRVGGPATASVVANGIIGLGGFSLACLVLHLTAIPVGPWWGLLLALTASVVFNLATWIVRRRAVVAQSVARP
jgi:uncharacterized membrane protein (GlpM family)